MFRGARTTFGRFCGEFAPGGIIDECTIEQRELAQRPPTNDSNEGGLGSYVVCQRFRPATTLHSYNGITMFQRNETQKFVDCMFRPEDHVYVMRAARDMDRNGLERKRKAAQVAFDQQLVDAKREKTREKQQRVTED
ncbi:hypothetical protein BDZ89DRAFT_911344, partial [Hymenopellis radicata]